MSALTPIATAKANIGLGSLEPLKPELYSKWLLQRLPTGETLDLPMSPQLEEIFRVLGAPD
jgi:hypothetical protein